LGGHCAAYASNIPQKIAGPGAQYLELSGELAAAFALEGTTGELCLETIHHFRQATLDLVDVVFEEHKGTLDVLEGKSLGHHLLDCIDSPDGFHWVYALASAVFPFSAYPTAAGQQTRLDILAEGRLRKSYALGLEYFQDRPDWNPSWEVPLDLLYLLRA
jgi:hypothetical protein